MQNQILVRYEAFQCEFERHGGGAGAINVHLTLTTKKGLSYQFHGISRTEFQNLVNFLTAKGLPMGEVDANALADRLIDEDDMAGIDDGGPALERGSDEDEDSEEDEDFKGASDSDGGEPTDSSSSKATRTRQFKDGGKEKPAKKKAKTNSGSPIARKREDNAPKRPLGRT